jgi:hypothetical protein
MGSYGSGIPIIGGASFTIVDCFKLYMFLDYLMGRPVVIDDFSDQSYTNREEVKSMMLSFDLGARFQFLNESRISPYGQLGVSVPLISNYKSTGTQTFGGNTTEWTQRTTLRPGIGCDAEGGVNFDLTDNFGLTAGITGRHLNLGRNESEITQYMVNGTDELSNIPEFQRMVRYQGEINENSNVFGNSNFDSDLPGDALRVSDPFSNWGLVVGIRGSF